MTGQDVFVLKNDICILSGEFIQNLPYLHELIQHAHAITSEPAQTELDCDMSTELNQTDVDQVMINTEFAPTNTESAPTETEQFKNSVNRRKRQTPSEKTSTKSFEHWHAAFGHVNSSVFKHQVYYEDGSLLPSPLQKYDCEVCSLAKSTHHIPSAATIIRASIPLELIHSDLSGRIAVPSLGGSFYYLSIIDDYTRFA